MTEQELILTYILGCERVHLYLDNPLLDRQQSDRLEKILLLRKQGQPLQYILGECEFMGLSFKVNKDVFIPRPETEILVEATIKIVKLFQPKADPPSAENCQTVRLLDIGTGSGCIAISLAKFLPNAKIFTTDISSKALKVAKENTRLNDVTDKIGFIHCNLFPISNLQSPIYNIIVSNPPYIQTNELANLPLEVQQEPKTALDGGREGLDFYRRIINESPKYLEDNGFLIMEMGYGQCYAIRNIFQESGNFEIIDIVRDYSEIERVIIAKINPKSEILNPKQTQNSKPKCSKQKRFGFGCFEFKEFEFI